MGYCENKGARGVLACACRCWAQISPPMSTSIVSPLIQKTSLIDVPEGGWLLADCPPLSQQSTADANRGCLLVMMSQCAPWSTWSAAGSSS